MLPGQGRKHGRLWFGESMVDTASTPSLPEIKARSTGSSPAVCARPTTSQIELEQLKAELEEQKRINAEQLRAAQEEQNRINAERDQRELAYIARQHTLEEFFSFTFSTSSTSCSSSRSYATSRGSRRAHVGSGFEQPETARTERRLFTAAKPQSAGEPWSEQRRFPFSSV